MVEAVLNSGRRKLCDFGSPGGGMKNDLRADSELGDQVLDMVGEERSPGLRRRCAPLRISRETVRSATLMPSLRSSP